MPISWRVLFHEFTRNPKLPESPDQFGQLLAQPTEITARLRRLDYLTGQALAAGLPNNYVALSGEGEVDVPPGDHELFVISDEGVRIWVDDRLVIDNWTAHESAIDRAPIARGKHKLRVGIRTHRLRRTARRSSEKTAIGYFAGTTGTAPGNT